MTIKTKSGYTTILNSADIAFQELLNAKKEFDRVAKEVEEGQIKVIKKLEEIKWK